MICLAAAAAAMTRKRALERYAILGSSAALLLALPHVLEPRLIFIDIMPGLFVLTTVAVALGWRRFRVRGLVNPVSNLPNLNALRANRDGRKHALIAARVLNYEEIAETLPAECRAPAGRADRLAPVGRLARPDAVPGRRRDLRLVRRAARSVRQSSRRALFAVPQPGPRRRPADRPDHRLRGRSRKQPLAFQPPVERPGRRRRGRARRAQVEVPRSRQPPGCLVEAVDAQPARRCDRPRRSLGRLPAQARPCDPADHRRRSARPLDPSRKGSDRGFRIRRRGRAARPHRQADRLRARESDRRRGRRSTASGASSRSRSICRRDCSPTGASRCACPRCLRVTASGPNF